jgi:hypothetical protein
VRELSWEGNRASSGKGYKRSRIGAMSAVNIDYIILSSAKSGKGISFFRGSIVSISRDGTASKP